MGFAYDELDRLRWKLGEVDVALISQQRDRSAIAYFEALRRQAIKPAAARQIAAGEVHTRALRHRFLCRCSLRTS
jgi:hypothetical protein